MSDTTALTLRIPAALHDRLRLQADRENRSINTFLIHTLRAKLDNSEPEALDHRDSMEALARAIQSVGDRVDKLESLARQAGADF